MLYNSEHRQEATLERKMRKSLLVEDQQSNMKRIMMI